MAITKSFFSHLPQHIAIFRGYGAFCNYPISPSFTTHPFFAYLEFHEYQSDLRLWITNDSPGFSHFRQIVFPGRRRTLQIMVGYCYTSHIFCIYLWESGTLFHSWQWRCLIKFNFSERQELPTRLLHTIVQTFDGFGSMCRDGKKWEVSNTFHIAVEYLRKCGLLSRKFAFSLSNCC